MFEAAPDGADSIPTRVEWLITKLSGEIRSGRLAAGSRLRQRDVAERFGVSTTPVREAFAALERQGAIRILPYKGAVVFNPAAEDLRAIHDIRVVLEPLAARKAAPRLTDAEIAALEAVVQEMGGVPLNEVERYHELNERFHRTIYRGAREPRLLKLVSELRDASAAYMRLYALHQPNRDATDREHRAIFEACRDRDPDRAAAATAAHLEHLVDFLSGMLPPHPPDATDSAGPEQPPSP
jgi:DNA-binding GntR family transcriptional regulator